MRVVQIEPGPMPTFTRVGAGIDQRKRRIAGGDVAADDVDARKVALDPAHTFDDAMAVAVRGIDDDRVDTGARQHLDALFGAGTDADGGADAQLAVLVARGVREVGLLGDVLHRHQPAQLERVVDDQHAFELVTVHQRLAIGERGAFAYGDEPLARRHDLGHRGIESRLETQVAIGDDADHGLAIEHRKAGDAMLLGQLHHLPHGGARRDRDRVAQHAGFVALDLRDFSRLRFRGQVLVDDADAAFLRDRDRQARFGDGVHCRRNKRQLQTNVAREARREAGVARQHMRERRAPATRRRR